VSAWHREGRILHAAAGSVHSQDTPHSDRPTSSDSAKYRSATNEGRSGYPQASGYRTCWLPFWGGREGRLILSVCPQAPALRAARPAHLLGDGGDEGGWSGGGDEGERVPRRAGRVGGWAQGQPHCDAKRAPDKEGRKKRSIRNIE